ncbi:hypothetical protein Herbaro_02700 [Herbaspirillum sp. WKF16]|jgi:hypothetical protein|uniref:hypothetical protein n=1 Tax=Herbaspirillum sp. WKF16 TaxID=3028312 RepID=UPI0023A92914|nr:hypothetical protein [Herbaspirillum sp. WKF16]WDZ96713.1 hypothetical protein Herbaro_02700 [Herbaspirillum sp. WKF16]
MLGTEIYRDFRIDITVSAIGENFRTFTCIARCRPRPAASISGVCDERTDSTAMENHVALERAFDRARKDVDHLVSNGVFARI